MPQQALRRTIVALLSALALVVGLGAPAGAAQPAVRPAIVGGQDATFADVPWQVLFIIDGKNVCGGSLVSPTKILSAAHCFAGYGTEKVEAWTGISEMSLRSARSQLKLGSIALHPQYDAATFANDVAVVTLASPVPARLNWRTIALPAAQDAATWPAEGTMAILAGFGETNPSVATASDRLQAASLEILASPASAVCGQYGASYLPLQQLCAGALAGGVDGCQGDSGGGLVTDVNGMPVLAGIASTGYGCAKAGYPGLFARATTYLPWFASQGIDINAKPASVQAPGTSGDGVPASFRVGATYPAGDFASIAKVRAKGSKVTVMGGRACAQDGRRVSFTRAGKCSLLVSNGARSARLIVTIYS